MLTATIFFVKEDMKILENKKGFIILGECVEVTRTSVHLEMVMMLSFTAFAFVVIKPLRKM
jgi:hypothetical protein